MQQCRLTLASVGYTTAIFMSTYDTNLRKQGGRY